MFKVNLILTLFESFYDNYVNLLSPISAINFNKAIFLILLTLFDWGRYVTINCFGLKKLSMPFEWIFNDRVRFH